MFSFNSPFGACPTCTGLGIQLKADPALIIPDQSKSILDGAHHRLPAGAASGRDGIGQHVFRGAGARSIISPCTTPVKDLPKDAMDVILYGTDGEKLELHYDRRSGKGVLQQRL